MMTKCDVEWLTFLFSRMDFFEFVMIGGVGYFYLPVALEFVVEVLAEVVLGVLGGLSEIIGLVDNIEDVLFFVVVLEPLRTLHFPILFDDVISEHDKS
jgi:hypothetical protein